MTYVWLQKFRYSKARLPVCFFILVRFGNGSDALYTTFMLIFDIILLVISLYVRLHHFLYVSTDEAYKAQHVLIFKFVLVFDLFVLISLLKVYIFLIWI
jgi:hypothetical protein